MDFMKRYYSIIVIVIYFRQFELFSFSFVVCLALLILFGGPSLESTLLGENMIKKE